jgi:hypothetical protein|nr:MAG TPA_asm: distal tail protein [Caudoviricetes sp.]
MAIHSAKIGNYDTLATWGLYMKVGSPNIGEPEPDETLVHVTGSDTLLNLTTALDGKVHYKKRSITMELLCTAPKKLWKVLQSRLHNALEGKWLQCVFDDDPSWYWEGLWHVKFVPGRLSATVTITGTCNPYKYCVYDGTQDIRWDDINFKTDILQDYRSIALPANTSVDVVVYGAPHTVAVYFQRGESEAVIILRVNNSFVGVLAKTTEWQYLERLEIPDGENVTLTFSNGSLSAASSIIIKCLGASL